jgi:hypothetical protein
MTNEKSDAGQACKNTDRHLWPIVSKPDDPYESIHVTMDGAIGINVCGNVIVKPLREWHRLAGGTPGRALGDDLRSSNSYHGAIYSPTCPGCSAVRASQGEAHE